MIRLKNILVEEEPKDPSKDPNKMLVKSKKTGQSYYINKDNFDASVHEKPEPAKKKKKQEPAPKETPKTAEEPKEKPKEEPKKLSPSEKLEKELGSFVFVDEKDREEIANDARSLRPDLKEKLLKFEFTSFFRNYDELLNNLSRQYSSDDKEAAKQTINDMKKAAKRIQGVAIAKLAALGTFSNDENTIGSAKFYHSSNNSVNDILRRNDQLLTNDEISKLEKQLDDNPHLLAIRSDIGSLGKYDRSTLRSMKAINDLDDHFKTDGAKLQYDVVTYRGIKKEILNQFVKSGEWVDNGFVSTSLNPIIAEDFTDRALVNKDPDRIERTPIFKINLKRGDRVLMLPCSEDEFCIESEITLPRGCRFKITGRDEEKNIYEVEVEIPNA